MKHGIYWIASYPRSGNTWTRGFLAALEDILSGRAPSGHLAGQWDRTLVKGDISAVTLKQRMSLQLELATSRSSISLVKTHSARVIINGCPIINPSATVGAVYLVRDPRDVAVSLAAMFKMSIESAIVRMGTRRWISRANDKQGFEADGSWSENVHSWRTSSDTLVLRYEDLQTAPVQHFSALVKHIGINASPIQIAQAVAASSFERMQAVDRIREALGQGHRLVRTGRTSQWREKLTSEQAARLETDHHAEMTVLGYL